MLVLAAITVVPCSNHTELRSSGTVQQSVPYKDRRLFRKVSNINAFFNNNYSCHLFPLLTGDLIAKNPNNVEEAVKAMFDTDY